MPSLYKPVRHLWLSQCSLHQLWIPLPSVLLYFLVTISICIHSQDNFLRLTGEKISNFCKKRPIDRMVYTLMVSYCNCKKTNKVSQTYLRRQCPYVFKVNDKSVCFLLLYASSFLQLTTSSVLFKST